MKLRRWVALLTCMVMVWTSVGFAEITTPSDLDPMPDAGQQEEITPPQEETPEEGIPADEQESDQEDPEAETPAEDPEADPEEEPSDEKEASEETSALSGYVMAASGTIAYADEKLKDKLGTFLEHSVVYAYSPEASGVKEEGVTKIAFCADGEVVTAFVRSKRLSSLTTEFEAVPDAVIGNIGLNNAAFLAEDTDEEQIVPEAPVEEPAPHKPGATPVFDLRRDGDPATATPTDLSAPATSTDLDSGDEPATLTDLAEEEEDDFFTFAEQTAAGKVTLRWNKPTGAKAYKVSCAVDEAPIVSKTATSTTYSFTSLPLGPVTFTVTAFSDSRCKDPIEGETHSVTLILREWDWASPFLPGSKFDIEQPNPDETVVLVTAKMKVDWEPGELVGFELVGNKVVLDFCPLSAVTLTPAAEGDEGIYSCLMQFKATVPAGKLSTLMIRPYILAKNGEHIIGTECSCKATSFTVKSAAWALLTLSIADVCQLGEDVISLGWNDIWDTDEDENGDPIVDGIHGYDVYEVIGKTTKLVYSGRAAECELSDVAYGKHTYKVQAWQKNSIGGKDVGKFSKNRIVTTKLMWNQGPVAVTAAQTSDTEPLARVTWTTINGWNPELVDGFEITYTSSKQKKQAHLDYIPVGEVTKTAPDEATGAYTISWDIVLPCVDKYSIYVRPYKWFDATVPEGADPDDYEIGNTMTKGATQKKAAVLDLKIGWMVEVPVLTLTQVDENKLQLSWTPNSVAHTYRVFEVAVVSKKTVYTLIDTVEDECSLLLDNVEYGKHSYAVLPVMAVSDSLTYEGTYSKTATLNTAVLWSQAPVLSYRQLSENSIQLNWTVKEQATYDVVYDVFVKAGKVTTQIGDHIAGRELMIDGDMYPLTIGTAYTFTVIPVKDEENGTASKALTVKLIQTWMVAPVVTLQQTNDDEITVNWTVLDEADSYTILCVNGKKKTTITVTADDARISDLSFSYPVNDLAPGVYSVTVKANKLVDKKTASGVTNAPVILTFAGYEEIASDAASFTYQVNGDGESVTITGYTGSADVIVIPKVVEGLNVTAIDAYAFDACSARQITIPSTVTTIGEGAFMDSSLRSVNIPASVTELGDSAFYYCEALTRAVVGSGVTALPYNLFGQCGRLVDVTLPASVTEIGENAFKGTKVSSVHFKGKKALWNTVNIGMGNSLLQYAATIYCADGIIKPSMGGKLTPTINWSLSGDTITISGTGEIPDLSGLMYQIIGDLHGYQFDVDGLDLVIGKGITGIGEYAFQDCNIRSVSLPATLTHIDEGAFCGCAQLASVDIPASVASIGSHAFDSTALRSVTLHEGLAQIGEYAFDYTQLESATIPASVTSIGQEAFEADVYLYVYPGTAGEAYAIESGHAYELVSTLTISNASISVKQHNTMLLSASSAPAADLVWTSSNEDVVQIVDSSDNGSYCVLKGLKLGSATVTATLKGGRASVSCEVSVTDGAGIAYTWEFANFWEGPSEDDSIVITGIKLNGATAVNIPSSINGHPVTRLGCYIAGYYDKDAKNVTSLTIPDTVTLIDDYCFTHWTSLSSVVIPDSVQYMGYNAFDCCYALKNVTVGSGITELNMDVFSQCSSLNSITLPAVLSRIGSGAFLFAENLKTVHFRGTMAQWQDISIASDNTNLLYFADIICSDGTISAANRGELDDGFTWTCADHTVTFSGTGRLPGNLCEFEYYVACGLVFDRVILNEGITGIPDDGFRGLGNLTSIVLPSTLTQIGAQALAFTNITELTIPAGVTSIGECAFDGTPLRVIHFGGTKAEWTDLMNANAHEKLYAIVHCSDGDLDNTVGTSGITANGIAWELDEAAHTLTISVDGTYNRDAEIDSLISSMKVQKVIFSEGLETIGNEAFAGSPITSVSFPSSLTAIGNEAFASSSLTSLNINGAPCSIGAYAFCWSSLTSVTLRNITRIGERAFSEIDRLVKVSIRNDAGIGALTLDSETFMYSEALETVELSAQVTKLPANTFCDCYSLRNVVLPSSLTLIDYSVFSSTALSSVLFQGTRAQWNALSIGTENDPLLYKAVINCSDGMIQPITSGKLGTISWKIDGDTLTISGTGAIPVSFDEIGYYILSSFDIRHLVIAKGITAIPDSAFANGCKLETVSLPSTLKSVGDDAFYNTAVLDSIVIPNTVTSLGEWAIGHSGISSAVIGTGVKVLPSGFFCRCYNLTEVTLPGTITRIERYAFDSTSVTTVHFNGTMAAWKKIIIGEDNDVLSQQATIYCTDGVITPSTGTLEGISWAVNGDTMTFSGSGTLSYRHGRLFNESCASKLVITDDVKVGYEAFYGCEKLTAVTITSNLSIIREDAFAQCRNLKNVTLPNCVTVLEDNAFWYCTALTSITIPSSLTHINGNCFDSCTGLTSLSFPESTAFFGSNAFSGCSALKSVTILCDNATFGYNVWAQAENLTVYGHAGSSAEVYCDEQGILFEVIPGGEASSLNWSISDNTLTIGGTGRLTSRFMWTEVEFDAETVNRLVIADGITAIDERALSGYRFNSITLPDSLKIIGSQALAYNEQLTEITIPDSVQVIGEDVFRNCSSLKKVTFNHGITVLDGSVLYGCTNLTTLSLPSSLLHLSLSTDTWATLRTIYYDGTKSEWMAMFTRYIPVWTQFGIPIICSDGTIEPDMDSVLGDNITWSLNGDTITFSGTGEMYMMPSGVGPTGIVRITGATKVIVGEGITTLCDNFLMGSDVTSVSLPSTLTSISESAFMRCSKLTNVTIPGSVTRLGFDCFAECTSLTSIVIPDSVVETDMQCFLGCTGVTSVSISANLTELNYGMFMSMNSLTTLTIPQNITYIQYGVVQDCSNLKSITVLNDSVTLEQGALDNTYSEDLVIYCNPGSTTETYCQENNIPYEFI